MQQGAYISGMAHGLLILWALFAGFFMRSSDELPIQTMDVSVLTREEFEELTLPDEPDLPQPEVAVSPEEVVLPEIEDELTPAVPEQDVANTIVEAPPVQPQPSVDSAPEAPESPEPPKPVEAERVAPDEAPSAPNEAETASEATPEVAPSEAAEVVAEETPETAPEEAAPEIITEAEQPSSAAPTTSFRPTARPIALASAPEADPEPDEQSDAIADALAAAATETPAPTPSGPPLSLGEKDALRVSVQKCWNVGALSTEALQTTVTIFVSMKQDGKPDVGSIRMLSFEGGSESAARQAYEAGRRAIIRCGASGFDLPREKYSHWQEIEMIFNPNNMRIK